MNSLPFDQLPGTVRKQNLRCDSPYHEGLSGSGEVWAQFYHLPEGYLIRFPGLSDFELDRDGREISIYPVAGVPQATLMHLYHNQVIPLALSRQGKLVLHASAIEVGEHAIAFLGQSGIGKSTLATSFALNGKRFLTDDGLSIEEANGKYVLRPGLASVRLWEDSCMALVPAGQPISQDLSFTVKSRIPAGNQLQYCDSPRLLCAMYLLGDEATDTPDIEKLGPSEAMIALVGHSFLLDQEAKDLVQAQFSFLSQLARQQCFFRLSYPEGFDRLAEVREVILAHAVSLAARLQVKSACPNAGVG